MSTNNRKLYLIGNAHLDPVWLWRWQEGFAEIKATFRSALDRMIEFPDFIFTSACALYYKWIEENAPEMFEEIKKRVLEGRWVIVGGWWIQPDCNVPSGESFVRQGLYSQRYFNKKFNIIAKVGYNVDSFGHNGMLPQILKKSGMNYYVFMRPNEEEKNIPYNLFKWESADGSSVMAYKLPFSYSHGYDGFEGDMDDLESEKMVFHSNMFLEKKFSGLLRLSNKRDIDLMGFYGVGNHGGGPTIRNLKLINKLRIEWGKDVIFQSSPNQYFEDMEKNCDDIPVVKDELQYHSVGCYSAHSGVKTENRKSEHRIITAEKFATIAKHILDYEYPMERIKRAWEKIMFNQFHDIMGGCSIKEAYDDSSESYGEALCISAEILNSSLQKISWSINTMGNDKFYTDKEKDWRIWETAKLGAPLVVFNPLSWDIKVPIQINKSIKGITDEKNNPLIVQKVRGSYISLSEKFDTVFIGILPAMGYRVFKMYTEKEYKVQDEEFMMVSEPNKVENSFIQIEFEKHSGYIAKLYDKKNDINILKGYGAVPIVIDENHCDTWAHGVTSFRKEIGKFSDAEFSVLEKGPVRTRVRVINRYNNSILQQDYIIYNDRSDIEVRVKLDWREKHKMLKLSFPVNVENTKATSEIPYGFIERSVDGNEQVCQQWIDLSGAGIDKVEKYFGLSILNCAKYSYDVKDNDMRITIVRSPIYADHFGERDEQCEFMDLGIHEFRYVLVPHIGSWKDANTVRKAYELNVPPVQVIESYHMGAMPLTLKCIEISSKNIIASVLKRTEEMDGYILRCYEIMGEKTETEIELPFMNRKWKVIFGKCEIKTFMIPDNRDMDVYEVNLIEM